MNRTRELFNKGVVYLLVFLIPSQLALHFWPSWSFIFGIRVDYLAPAIYLTDVLVLVLIAFNLKIYRHHSKYLLWLFLFALSNVFFSTAPMVSVYKWLKIFEFVGLGIYFLKSPVKTRSVIKVLFISSILFSLIGILQFFTGRNLGGLLYFLGERSFNLMTPGIALVNLFGESFLRAYSTFSHPNSAAGFLGVVLILLLDVKPKDFYQKIGLGIVIIGFIFTFSLAASLGLVMVLGIKYIVPKNESFRKVVTSLLLLFFFAGLTLPLFSRNLIAYGEGFGQSLVQRLELSLLSGKMVSERFLTGEGLNTFIINSPRFGELVSQPWLLQPVHNVSLLVFSETGIVGLLALFLLIYVSVKKALVLKNTTLVLALLFVVITGSMDHYWFTLQQNMLLASLLLGLSVKHSAVK